MRILHFAQWTPSNHCGVTRKIVEQCQSWRENGVDATSIMLSVKPVADLELPSFVTVVSPSSDPGDSLAFRYLAKARAVRRIANLVRAFAPNITYARTFTWAPGYLGAIAPGKLVLEVNTNDEVECRSYPFTKQMFYRHSLRRLYRRADAFVTVTPDLAGQMRRFDKPVVAIGNGISPARFDASLASNGRRERSVLFVGTPGQPWHGLDRVLMLAQAMPDVEFHVVGSSGSQDELHNVSYHGLLDRQALANLYSRCSVGLGSLAMERVGMNSSSSLKVREYLACGLGVLLESPDADLEGLHGLSVVRWGAEWVGRASSELERLLTNMPERSSIREAALRRCGSIAVERRRLSFFSRVNECL